MMDLCIRGAGPDDRTGTGLLFAANGIATVVVAACRPSLRNPRKSSETR